MRVEQVIDSVFQNSEKQKRPRARGTNDGISADSALMVNPSACAWNK